LFYELSLRTYLEGSVFYHQTWYLSFSFFMRLVDRNPRPLIDKGSHWMQGYM